MNRGHVAIRLCALLAVLPLVQAPTAAWAHGGGLDKNGCHTDRKTGRYHCHGTPRAAQPAAPAPQPRQPPAPSTLFAAPAEAAPLPAACGASRDDLRAAARALLIALGYLNPKTEDIGGAMLGTATRNFQRDVFLEPSGQIDGRLLVRLAEEVARRAAS